MCKYYHSLDEIWCFHGIVCLRRLAYGIYGTDLSAFVFALLHPAISDHACPSAKVCAAVIQLAILCSLQQETDPVSAGDNSVCLCDGASDWQSSNEIQKEKSITYIGAFWLIRHTSFREIYKLLHPDHQ